MNQNKQIINILQFETRFIILINKEDTTAGAATILICRKFCINKEGNLSLRAPCVFNCVGPKCMHTAIRSISMPQHVHIEDVYVPM